MKSVCSPVKFWIHIFLVIKIFVKAMAVHITHAVVLRNLHLKVHFHSTLNVIIMISHLVATLYQQASWSIKCPAAVGLNKKLV